MQLLGFYIPKASSMNAPKMELVCSCCVGDGVRAAWSEVMGLVLGAGSFSAHCQQIKVSGQVKRCCRQEEKVCEVVKTEQASAGARKFSVRRSLWTV